MLFNLIRLSLDTIQLTKHHSPYFIAHYIIQLNYYYPHKHLSSQLLICNFQINSFLSIKYVLATGITEKEDNNKKKRKIRRGQKL